AGRVHKSVGNSTTTPRDIMTRGECISVISALCETVAARLRKSNYTAQGVSLYLKYNDLTGKSVQAVMPNYSDSASFICTHAIALLDKSYTPGKDKPLRGMGVSTFAIADNHSGRQLNLFDIENTNVEKNTGKLDKTVDLIRAKYGFNSIKYASSIKDAILCDDLEDGDDDGYVPFKK
ncbi:MAG: hypothetical protein K2I79_05185, partial [Clostridia bacterium]|nr:hypothetical protein [Clostridia bacterium]